MLKRFEKVTGSYIETIAGQKRFAFSHWILPTFTTCRSACNTAVTRAASCAFMTLSQARSISHLTNDRIFFMVIQSTWKTNTIFYRAILTAN